jgi:uncharacterized protein (TIGR03086 family)
MESPADRYRRRAAAFAEVIAAVPADRWASRSPCPDWTALDVVRHVVESQATFLNFVESAMPPGPAVDDDPLGAFVHATGTIQANLDDPDVAGRTFEGMMGTQTFTQAVDRFLSFDLVVHRWDIARATGGDESIDPGDVEALQASAESMGAAMRGPWAFGTEVPVADDANPQERLLAFLGREP